MPLLYLSAYFERHRKDYYDLLLAVSERGVWRDWLLYFLKGVAEQSRDAIARAKRLQDLQLAWRVPLQQAHVSALLLGMVDHLFQQPVVSAADVQKRFGVSHPTAMQVLKRLVGEGILKEMTGRERHRRYFAERLLQIVVE